MARPKRHMVKTTPQSTTTPQVVKEEAVKETIYLQFQGKEISNETIVSMVKSAWTEAGKNVKDIKTLDVYVKPEESQLYYVINGTDTGNLAY